MYKLSVQELLPGMKLAKDVYMNDGRLLLLAGFLVKDQYIEKLVSFGIPYVYVENTEVHPVELSDNERIYSEAFQAVKSVLTSVRGGKPLDAGKIKETVGEIVTRIINNETVITQLSGLRDIDNYTYFHSIDVCIYSVITGKNMGMTPSELTDLGISAILHDVGKCKVPYEILGKPARLTQQEFEIMKLHSEYSHKIISETQGLDPEVAEITLQHHEKRDGSGYPAGLKNSEIHPFARIITISDIYDALTADRVYKKKILPHEAAEYVLANSAGPLDPEIAGVFVRNIKIYPEGTAVILNTGEIGMVLPSEDCMPTRPKISIISRKDGPPVFEPYIINLMERPTVFVTDIIG